MQEPCIATTDCVLALENGTLPSEVNMLIKDIVVNKRENALISRTMVRKSKCNTAREVYIKVVLFSYCACTSALFFKKRLYCMAAKC
jgi:hypothetical protein